MIPQRISLICPAKLRASPRKSAGRGPGVAGAPWKFLGLRDSHDHSRWNRLRLDVAVATQHAHPTLERSRVEAGLFLNLAIADRRPAQHPADAVLLTRLPQDQPAIEPKSRAHALVMPRFKKHAPQPCVVILSSHGWDRITPRFLRPTRGNLDCRKLPERMVSTHRSTERALPRTHAAPNRESRDAILWLPAVACGKIRKLDSLSCPNPPCVAVLRAASVGNAIARDSDVRR